MQPLFVCCVKTEQFNKIVICTQRDGNNQIQDNVLITARTKQSLIDTFQQLKNNSMKVRLTINEKKTKYLKCTKQDIRIENLNINSSYIEQVQQYKYLGSIINDSNSIEEEARG